MTPLQPYPFQQTAIDLGIERNLFLNDECGLGKTLQCIEIARAIRDEHHRPTLIVTVKRATHQWKYVILNQAPAMDPVIGTVDPIWVPEVPDWTLILYYEAMVRHIKSLSRMRFGTIILDEGHYIKSWQAQRSKAAKKLRAIRKVVATGTPMDKSPGDLWSQLQFLYPEQYNGTRRAFCDKYERSYVDTGGIRHILPGTKAPAALSKELAPFTLARRKVDVVPDLPPNIEKIVHIKLTGGQESLYRRIQNADDIIVQHPDLDSDLWIANAMAQMVKEQQCAIDPALLRSSAESAKYEWLRDWREGNPDEPLIIFTNYRGVAEHLARTYDSHLIMGGRALPERWVKNTLVCTIKAASEALDLGFIHTAIFMDTNASQLRMTQAINRIDRLGKLVSSETIYLTAIDTVDEIILASWREKYTRYQMLKHYIAWRQGAKFDLTSLLPPSVTHP